MLTLVILVFFGVAMVGAPITIALVSRAVSYGKRPSKVEGTALLYDRPVRVNHDTRRFGPSIYELDVWPGTLGITWCRNLFSPMYTMARLFYPQWWFNISEAEISTSKSKVLWRAVSAESIVIRYRRDGKEHSIEVVPEEIAILLERLDQAGFNTGSGSPR
jgi:hypothetical protein